MQILKQTIREFIRDEAPRLAAALSYYTVFSLPAVLLLIMVVAQLFADPITIQEAIMRHMRTVVGPSAARQVGEIVSNAGFSLTRNPLIVGLGVVALLFAATGAFAQLQAALNRIWGVEPDPERGDIRNFLVKRAFSFLMILGVALLLLASIVANTLIARFGGFVAANFGGEFPPTLIQILNLGLSLVVATLLFAAMFQVLPDARVRWRDVWIGALATATLFMLGNFLLGLYLARSDPGSAFGAAGSLAIILIWVYYSAMIFFLGAELTQVVALGRGGGIRPTRGAVRVVIERHVIREEK